MMIRPKILSLLTAISLTTLVGCAVGPDYERPVVPVPDNYRKINGTIDASNWLQARWWTQYGDPGLNELVSAAIANNRTLQQTMANVERAAAAVTVARSDLFPQLNYQGDFSKQRASENTVSGAQLQGEPVKTTEVLASASWEIDLWGKIRRQTESATANLRAMEAAHKAAISSVIGSTVSTYLSLLMTDEQIKIAQETAQSYYNTYKLFRVRAQYGNLSEMEVAQAKSQWQSAKVQVPSLMQNRVQLLNSLSILTGIAPAAMPKFKKLNQLQTPTIAKGIPSELLTMRPDVVQAEEELVSANADIGAARALYFPSISLSAGYGFSSEQLKDLFKSPSKLWSYTGTVTGPIFHWGAIAAGVKSAEAEQKAMLASYQLAVAQAFVDVDNALSSRENLVTELQDKRDLVKSLQLYEKLAYEQYQNGYVGYATVLQAEQSLLPQQISLAQVKAESLEAVAKIYQALGGGWIDQALLEEQKAIVEAEKAIELEKQLKEEQKAGLTPVQSPKADTAPMTSKL